MFPSSKATERRKKIMRKKLDEIVNFFLKIKKEKMKQSFANVKMKKEIQIKESNKENEKK